MATYNPSTNFGAKDDFSPGNTQKIIRGSEFDTEFTNIQTAVNAKANQNNAALTGNTSVANLNITNTFEIGGVEVTVSASDINTASNVLSNTNTWTGVNTFSEQVNLKETKETVYALSGTDIDPANGTIQTKTLSAATTFTESLESGQSIVLMLEGGDTHQITWPAITWVSPGGNVTYQQTAKDVVTIWKVGSVLYGAYGGSYV